MKVLLHTGAHRTATTSFQGFLWNNRVRLAQAGVTTWTPRRTRDGLMAGMMRHPALLRLQDDIRARRSVGRVRMEADRLERLGQQFLLVSEENMIGSAVNNLADLRLYPMLRERMSRFAEAFEGREMRIGLAIRSYEDYWASVIGYAIMRGHSAPDPDTLDCLVTQPRRWRSVIRDMAQVFDGAEILVWPFESLASRPAFVLGALTGQPVPRRLEAESGWHNKGATALELAEVMSLRGEAAPTSPVFDMTSRWMPFDEDQRSALRAEYRRDLAWLRSGAEGLATFIDGRTTPATPDDRIQEASGVPPGALPSGGRQNGIEKGLG